MSKLQELKRELSHRVLVLDGAMGTMIQRQNFTENDYRGERFIDYPHLLKGNNDLLSLTQPTCIKEIHKAYLEAGANLISTNTFNANRISMADYAMQDLVAELNRTSVKLVREAIEEYRQETQSTAPAYVVASIGPTNKSASLSPDVNNPGARNISFDDLVDAYGEQVGTLIDAGVDILLIETVFDTLNCKAALYAIHQELDKRSLSEYPVMVSGTITDKSGRVLSGQTVESFLNSVSHFPLLSIGLNCSFGADLLLPYVEELAQKAPFYVSAHPNAGLPNQLGAYDETPLTMRDKVSHYLDRKLVNIIGGCCGTSPDHIREIARLAHNAEPRKIATREPILKLSGLEPLNLLPNMNFINIGERTNVAGSRKFARLIREEKYEEAISIAREMVEGGAQVIDINMDDSMLDAQKSMITFLNLLASEPDIARLPFMIDSSKWEVIEAGLKCIQGKSIVNSISLKEGEDLFLAHAKQIKRYGAAVVVMAFDENGQADTLERRIEICTRSYKLLTEQVQFPPQDIIFDPNILAIATGIESHNHFAVDFIDTVKYIKQNLPLAKVSGGVSNLSFSFRGNNTVREAMHSVFLYHAIKAGMDMGIVNPGMLQIYDTIPEELLKPVEDVVLDIYPEATERLIALADKLKGSESTTKEQSVDQWRKLPVVDRLKHALMKGDTQYLKEDILEALPDFPQAIKLIEGPLMDGMKVVGTLFGEGKMFLPQVVKTARVMKKAVSILQPYIEKGRSGENAKKAGKVVIATVKGDVHDIGKNIVSVVMACNNFEVIDLGVMVPCADIIEAIKKQRPDFVCLSGLITPSLEEMLFVAKEMERNHFTMPLLVGGATTSKLHTAVKIAPAYSGLVVHCSDASQNVTVMTQLLAPDTQAQFEQSIRTEYESIRTQHYYKEHKMWSLEEAREKRHRIADENWPISSPNWGYGNQKIDLGDLSDLHTLINWNAFFHAWGVKNHYSDRTTHAESKIEAEKLLADAHAMFDKITQERWLEAKAVIGLYPAKACKEDILLYSPTDRNRLVGTLHCLRNQLDMGGEALSLADFIRPADEDQWDTIGLFALTTALGLDKRKAAFLEAGDEYSALLLQTLADRLAEAFSERLHQLVRTKYWGYAAGENLTAEELLRGHYQGIRPALGYPSIPDHSEKELLFSLLEVENIGVTLTENYMMTPASSICGLYLAHPSAHYFMVHRIQRDQLSDYICRKNRSEEQVMKQIGHLVEENIAPCACCAHTH